VLDALAEHHLVERVLLVPVEGTAGRLGDRLAVVGAPVVDVAAVAGVHPHGAQLDALAGQEVFEHVSGLAAQGGAEDHGHVERGDHAGLPDPLPTGVDVDVGLACLVLDGDGEQRRGCEDDDCGRHVRFVPTRAISYAVRFRSAGSPRRAPGRLRVRRLLSRAVAARVGFGLGVGGALGLAPGFLPRLPGRVLRTQRVRGVARLHLGTRRSGGWVFGGHGRGVPAGVAPVPRPRVELLRRG
jgi:hypothetical protein